MPRPVTTLPTPAPQDPVKQAREKLEAQRAMPPSFASQVRQQVALLENELVRLEAQMVTLQQTHQDRRDQLQHLSAYLAVAAQDTAPQEG